MLSCFTSLILINNHQTFHLKAVVLVVVMVILVMLVVKVVMEKLIEKYLAV